MLLIAGSIRIDATHRGELIAAGIEMLREFRGQTGCTHAALSTDLEDPGVLHLIHKWESQEALLRNIAARPASGIAKRAGALGVREMALLRYDVGSAQPVGPGSVRRPSAIAIAGQIRIDPSRRSEAIALAIEIMAAARERKGCLSYVISADIGDPGLLHLFGEWEHRDALRAQVTGPNAVATRKRFDAVGVREIDLERFDIRSAGPIV